MKLRFAAFYAGLTVLFIALYGVMIMSNSGMTLLSALRSGFFSVAPAALLGIVVWALCARTPWTEHNRVRFFAIHAIAAALFSAAWAGVTVAQIAIFTPSSVLAMYMQRAFGWQVIMGLMTYGVIAGISYAVQLTTRLAEQRTLAARAELQVLRAQLNPHFLFNTLHSVTALVRSDPDAVEDALVRFGSLLRYVLDASKRDEDATVEDEIGFVRAYIELERMRLGDRLRVVEEIDQDALDCLVPALTLQPLVENAIRHGIAPRADGGELRINAQLEGDQLVIEVRDDGPGAIPDTISNSDGVGLSLVKKRIAARFGPEGHVDIKATRGFAVTVRAPAHSMRPEARQQKLNERFAISARSAEVVS